MGNLFAPNALDQLKNSLGSPQPGVVSNMVGGSEPTQREPKKSFLAGAGWKKPAGWSPWNMWTSTDVTEGAMNANRSLENAVRLPRDTGYTPASANPGLVSNMVSSQPLPMTNPTLPASPTQTEAVAPKKKKRRNRAMSPYGTTPSSMGMY